MTRQAASGIIKCLLGNQATIDGAQGKLEELKNFLLSISLCFIFQLEITMQFCYGFESDARA
jgi:hypothetical protein